MDWEMDSNRTEDGPARPVARDFDAGVHSMADVLDEFWSQYRSRFPESEVSTGEETMAVAVA